MTSKKIIFAISTLALLISCGQSGNIFRQIMGYDPEPPEGYNPVFISNIKKIDEQSLANSKLIVSRIDPYKEDRVRLFVHLVENNNTFLTGATEGEFKKKWCLVTDSVNGTEYTIKDFKIREAAKDDRKPQAIAMVMDHSGSMGDNRALEVQKAVDNFLDISKKLDDRIALIKYDDSVGIECSLTDNISELKSKFQRNGLGEFGGQTATLDGILAGINQLSTADRNLERIVVVFTDGQDNNSSVSKEEVINLARKYNVIVCAIDYGISIQENFLENIANSTNGTYHHIYKAEEFNLVFRDIYQRLEKYYEIEFESPDFGIHKVKLKLCNPSQTDITAEGTYDNMPYEGLTTIIDINFDTGKDNIKKESAKVIDRVYKLMSQNPKMTIELRGHTDSRGDKDKNIKLSQDRANAVRNALVKKGIDASRISAKGYGDSMPLESNDTEAGRAKNRRTEFLVLSK